MKAYQDKTTGLWKWGTRGEAKYNSKIECEKAGLNILIDRLQYIKDKLNKSLNDYGKK